MSRDNEPLSIGERIWSDDPFVRALNLSAELGTTLGDIAASGHAPDENAGRVAELERQLTEAHEARRQVIARGEDAERQLAERTTGLVAAQKRIGELSDEIGELGGQMQGALYEKGELESMLQDAYVAREVPWADVAAGMMTIARDGTPWMVESRTDDVVQLIRGGTVFPKKPEPGETVRVLVPYVTPEQAESLVANELGGTVVS